MTDEANLRTAKINLGYTDISAPIAGKIGRTSLTKGNVVGPESGPLTTIVSQDPMYVTFPVSQREFLEARVRPKTSSWITKLSHHEADGREFQEREGIAVEIFPVLCKAATTVEPRNRAFYDPALG